VTTGMPKNPVLRKPLPHRALTRTLRIGGGPYRAINHDPATGRTYAREADYLTPKQARSQRIKQPRR
jgi:hypothetical protein